MRVIAQREVWHPAGEGKRPQWSHTMIKFEHKNEIYQARSNKRLMNPEKIQLSDLEIESSPIPRENLYAAYPGGLSIAPYPLPNDCFLKKHKLMLYDTPLRLSHDKTYPGQLLIQQAKFCDILRQHPHPNLASYRGCVVEEGLVIGLCFAKYHQTLKQRVQEDPRPLNKEECIRGIEAGICHLHSLGYVHNDINTHNIMFLDDEVPVITDFDTCWKESKPQGINVPTNMWTDNKESVRENDFSSLRRIRQYLDDPETFHL